MKNLKTGLLLLVLFAFTNMQCEKSKAEKEDKLPAETQEGKNTFGCLVDGILWLPKDHAPYPGISISTGGGFTLTASNYNSGILFYTDEISEGETIAIIGNKALFSRKEEGFTSTRGELKIKKYDKVKQIVAGVFNFTAKNTKGDSIVVTDGRFDVKLP